METSYGALNDPSHNPVLPQILQDESLIHMLNGLADPDFPQCPDSSLENFNILFPEPLQFTTSNPLTTKILTPSLSNCSQDTLADLASPLLYQDSPVRSDPCTPQLHHQASNHDPSRIDSGLPPHLQNINYFNPPPNQPPPSHPAALPSPAIVSTHDKIFHYTLHRRSHSQPPQEAPFFLPASSSARPITSRIPPPHTARWRRHPYARARNRKREGPTSAPPTAQSTESPWPQGLDCPRFVRMQSVDAQSPRAIEVGAARVIVGSPLPGALGLVEEEGEMAAGRVEAVLGLVGEIEKQLREGLRGCGVVRGLLAKAEKREGGGEVESAELLRLGKRSVTASPVPEPDAFIESLPQVKLASLQGVNVIIGEIGKVE